jgi:hypothetical protein
MLHELKYRTFESVISRPPNSSAADHVPFVGPPLPRLALGGFRCQHGRQVKARGG